MNESTIYKFLNNQLSDEEIIQLRKWIQQSEDNKKQFAETKYILTTLTQDQEDINLTAEDEFKKLKARIKLHEYAGKSRNVKIFSKSKAGIGRYILLSVAASLIFLFGLFGIISVYNGYTSNQYNEIRTLKGEKSVVTLSDGTRIWLNSETLLRYPSNVNQKKVKVFLEGEAFFKVSKKRGRTFLVQASTLEITALGTSFNVKSYSNEGIIETTLEEGKIAITGKIGTKQLEQPILLKPNMQATFISRSQEYYVQHTKKEENNAGENDNANLTAKENEPAKEELILSEEVDTKLFSGWKDGKLIFKSESFEDLAVRMERWYDVQIVIQDTQLGDKKYTGTFEKETIEQALKALSLSMPFDYTINQNIITIKKNFN